MPCARAEAAAALVSGCPGQHTARPPPHGPSTADPAALLSQVEPELLHLLVLLDARRSGAASSDKGTATAAAQEGVPPMLCCSVADADAVPSPWQRKAEAWRKAVTAALRPLHKELQALEASGTLPSYKASRLEQLQSDAAMLICNLQVSHASMMQQGQAGCGASCSTRVGVPSLCRALTLQSHRILAAGRGC